MRFFCHIHKYHPDYWRVFSGGRPLSDFIEMTGPDSQSSSSSSPRRGAGSPGDPLGVRPSPPAASREKRYSCNVCHKRYCNQTGYVKHMAVHPGLADELLRVAGDEHDAAARMALYNCVVCSKLFTKEAYLLRHMEMKLDPAHAVGLEQLKKSSSMFRSTPAAADTTPLTPAADGGCRPSSSSSYVAAPQSHAPRSSAPTSVDDVEVGEDERGVGSSPGVQQQSARYVDDPRPPDPSSSRSCVSPLSTSSASPVSPPPMTSFVPYSPAAAESRRVAAAAASSKFLPGAGPCDVLRYSHPIASAAAAAAAAADYHLRRGIVDVAGYASHSPSSYRVHPPTPHSPAGDDDTQPGSSPETDDRFPTRCH